MENENKVKNLNDAISVLIQGVNIAQTKGAYSFEDSAIIGQALDFLKAQSAQGAPKMEVLETAPKEEEKKVEEIVEEEK